VHGCHIAVQPFRDRPAPRSFGFLTITLPASASQDHGTGNFTLSCENLMKIGEQVLAEWTEKREKEEAKQEETLAYLDSKEYQVKKRKQDKHDQKMKAMRLKIKENNMSSKRKKQLKKIGQDRMTISPHLDFEKEASKVSNRASPLNPKP